MIAVVRRPVFILGCDTCCLPFFSALVSLSISISRGCLSSPLGFHIYFPSPLCLSAPLWSSACKRRCRRAYGKWRRLVPCPARRYSRNINSSSFRYKIQAVLVSFTDNLIKKCRPFDPHGALGLGGTSQFSTPISVFP